MLNLSWMAWTLPTAIFFVVIALLLVTFTILAIVFMPVLVLAMASGFAGDARFDLAVTYGRIAFVYILFISLAALLSGVLNANGRFAAAAAAPVLLNIILVAMLAVAETGLVENAVVIGAVLAISMSGVGFWGSMGRKQAVTAPGGRQGCTSRTLGPCPSPTGIC